MTFGSLFAGIGGIDLGLERAGLRCSWQVEIDAYCRLVLAKHWPSTRRHDDIRSFPPPGSPIADWGVDLIAGGFPCQDISGAGKKAGIDGPKSGLWREFARVVRALRPPLVLVENSAALALRGLDRVLGDLAAAGYDAEWSRLSASQVGGPHVRRRIFILAHSRGVRRPKDPRTDSLLGQELLEEDGIPPQWECDTRRDAGGKVWPAPECLFHGMADGIPGGLDEARIRALGSAVVPELAYRIGRAIVRGM